MEGEGRESDQGLCVKVWTYLIEGGEPFRVTLGRREHVHDGLRSIWHVTASLNELPFQLADLRACGAEVTVITQDRGTDNKDLRRPGEDYEPFTPLCMLCYYYDPEVLGECGLEGWPRERVEVSWEDTKARGDMRSCPRRSTDADL